MADNTDDVAFPDYAAAPAARAAPAPAASGDVALPGYSAGGAPAASGDVAFPAYADQRSLNEKLKAATEKAIRHGMGMGTTDEQSLNNHKAIFNQLLFGLGDDVRALFPGAVKGDTIPDRLRQVHAERKAYDDSDQPKDWTAQIGANLVGGAGVMKALGGLAGKIAPKAVDYAVNGEGLGPFLARHAPNIPISGLFGAAGEAGKADPGQVVDAAKDGAIAGSIVGPLTGMATGGARWGVDKGLELGGRLGTWAGARPTGPLADKLFVEHLAKAEDLTPQQYADRIKAASEGGDVPALGVDVLSNGSKGLVKKLAGTNADTANTIDDRLGERGDLAPSQIMQAISKHVHPMNNTALDLNSLSEARKAQSAPFFDQAMATPTIGPDGKADQSVVDLINKNQFMQEIMRDALEPKRRAGQPLQAAWTDGPPQPAKLPPVTKMVEDPSNPGRFIKQTVAEDNPDAGKPTMTMIRAPSMRDLHTMKRQVDTLINATKDEEGTFNKTASFNGANYQYDTLKVLKKQIVDTMDNLTKDPVTDVSSYAKARQIFAGHSQLRDAMKLGKEVANSSPGALQLALQNMESEGERDALLAGVAGHMTDVAGSNTTAMPILNKLLNTPYAQERLTLLLPEADRDAFTRKLQLFKQMYQTNKIAKGGNIPNMGFLEGARDDKDLVTAMLAAATGHVPMAMAAAGRHMVSKAGEVSGKVADPLLQRFLMNPEQAQTFAQDHAARQSSPFRNVVPNTLGALSSVYNQIPKTVANFAGQNRETVGGALNGALSTYLNTEDQK